MVGPTHDTIHISAIVKIHPREREREGLHHSSHTGLKEREREVLNLSSHTGLIRVLPGHPLAHLNAERERERLHLSSPEADSGGRTQR